jgi:hypothetical protein
MVSIFGRGSSIRDSGAEEAFVLEKLNAANEDDISNKLKTTMIS